MLKNRFLKNIIIIFIMIITIFSLTGCSREGNDENIKNEKLDSEIQFLDTKFISLMNTLNNISFSNYKVVAENVKKEGKGEEASSSSSSSSSANGESKSQEQSSSDSGSSSNSSSGSGSNSDSTSTSQNEEENKLYSLAQNSILSLDSNEDVKWDLVKSEVENLYSIWTTIIIDFHSAGVNNDDILQFNNLLDALAKASKDENKEEALNNLSELYSLLPKYLNSYSNDDFKKNVYNTKARLLTAYCMSNSDNKWEEMGTEILKANEEFSNIMNNVNIDKNKQLNVNRAYLLLKETQKSIEDKDKDVFLLKYKNTIQELNML